MYICCHPLLSYHMYDCMLSSPVILSYSFSLTTALLLPINLPSISMSSYLSKAHCIYLGTCVIMDGRTRESYQWLKLRNVTSPPSETIVYCSSERGWDCMSPSPFRDGILIGSVFYKSCAGSYCCCETCVQQPCVVQKTDCHSIRSHSWITVILPPSYIIFWKPWIGWCRCQV